jgi:hypothetical protein
MNNNNFDIFKNTISNELKISIRFHFANSVLNKNEPAEDADFRSYFGYYYDIDSFWQNTYVYLLRRDLDRKRFEIDYKYKIKIITDGVLELGCHIETVTPHLFKVFMGNSWLYNFGLTPHNKLFFSADDDYRNIRYLPDYTDLLRLIYSFHDEYSIN